MSRGDREQEPTRGCFETFPSQGQGRGYMHILGSRLLIAIQNRGYMHILRGLNTNICNIDPIQGVFWPATWLPARSRRLRRALLAAANSAVVIQFALFD